MSSRRKMTSSQSRKSFKKNTGSRRINAAGSGPNPKYGTRGGIRL